MISFEQSTSSKQLDELLHTIEDNMSKRKPKHLSTYIHTRMMEATERRKKHLLEQDYFKAYETKAKHEEREKIEEMQLKLLLNCAVFV